MSGTLLTEVPSSLKQLARLVVRGFYTIEDTLIVDMLVRNPCMKEDDLCELLKFERKMLRARIATLRTDKFIQVRLRMETGADGKAQKVNYYFINYKTFVNVVKYKLDVVRKRLETEERDATRRASFKCPGCAKTFTDLEADQLFDPMSEDFRCTHCHEIVEEDQAALPKKDSRVILARFNEQMEPLYILLREVDGIDLAPEILEPEPVDINMIRGVEGRKANGSRNHELWSGDHSRSQGFAVEDTRIDVTISDNNVLEQNTVVRKERPIWMVQSTVVSNEQSEANTATTDTTESMLETVATNSQNVVQPRSEDIMSVLLAHEKRANNTANALKNIPGEESDSDSLEMDDIKNDVQLAEVGVMDSEDEDSQPQVQVGHRTYLLQDINDEHIACMTPAEKEAYIQTYQEYYSHIYD